MSRARITSAIVAALLCAAPTAHASKFLSENLKWLNVDNITASARHPEAKAKLCALMLEKADLAQDLAQLRAVGTEYARPKTRRHLRRVEREWAEFDLHFETRVIGALRSRRHHFQRVVDERAWYRAFRNDTIAAIETTAKISGRLTVAEDLEATGGPVARLRSRVYYRMARQYYERGWSQVLEVLRQAEASGCVFPKMDYGRAVDGRADLDVYSRALVEVRDAVDRHLNLIDERVNAIVEIAITSATTAD